MAAQSNFALEIDESIKLFPIPGRLPVDFFEDIPSDARAIFSTYGGTKPLRTLHTPIPVHLVGPRQGDHLEIDAKALSLRNEHPELAESVTTPPMAWKDLYNYFDAVDIWKEGAGHLFYVLGRIYRANRTRYNCLQEYVVNWVSMNEEFVTQISATEDVLSALSTESCEYFGMDQLTKRETEDLRLAIIAHRDALQRKQEAFRLAQIDTMRIRALRDPSIISMERQRPSSSTAVNPYDCGPIHTYLRDIVNHPVMNDFQARSRSNSHYQNRDFTQFHESSVRNLYAGSMSGAETVVQFNGSQSNYLHGPPGSSNEMQRVSRGPNHLDPYGNHQAGFNGFNPVNPPIYVFNPQKPTGSCYSGNATTDSQRQEQTFSFRPETSIVPGRDPGCVTQVGRAPPKYDGISNDARLHRMSGSSQRRVSVSQELEPMTRNQSFHRPHYSRDGSARDYTVFVGGFLDDGSSTDWIPELLSECGKVVSFKHLSNRSISFVTFDNAESTFRAIDRFNGFMTFQDRHLTVAMPRHKTRNVSFENHSTHNSGDMTRSSSQNWSQESPPTGTRERQYSDPRIAGQAWSHSRNSSFHTTPPKYRSPMENNNNMAAMKPHGKSTKTASFSMMQPASLYGGIKMGSAEDCFQTQLDTVAKAADRNKKLKETTPRKSVKSDGLSSQVSGTIKKRTVWTNKNNEPANNTSTKTPPKKSVLVSRAGSGKLGAARRDSLAGGVKRTKLAANSKGASFENLENAPGVSSVSQSPPSQAPLTSDIVTDVQHKILSSRPPSTKVSSERPVGKLREAVSRPFQSEGCAEFNEGGQNRTSSFAGSLESGETVLHVSTDNLVKGSNEAQEQPHFSPKRKRKNVKRFPSKDNSRDSMDKGNLSAGTSGISTEKIPGANSEESFSRTRSDSGNEFSRVRSDSEATTMSAFSGLEMPLKAKQRSASRDDKVMKSSSLAEIAPTVSSSPSSQASKQGDTPNKANATSGDDVFIDDNKASVKSSPETQRQRHKKVNSRSSVGSSARLPGNRNQEGSPTPIKRVRPSPQRKEPVKKDMESEKSEEDRTQLLVTQMLSDLTHWPELGSTNPPTPLKIGHHQRTATVIRTFDPRVAMPRLPRRDTTASSVSESLQSARGQTIESPGHDGSSSCGLWPRVRRQTLQSSSSSNDAGSGPPSAEP